MKGRGRGTREMKGRGRGARETKGRGRGSKSKPVANEGQVGTRHFVD